MDYVTQLNIDLFTSLTNDVGDFPKFDEVYSALGEYMGLSGVVYTGTETSEVENMEKAREDAIKAFSGYLSAVEEYWKDKVRA